MATFSYGHASRPRLPLGSAPLVAVAGDSVTYATISQNTATLTANSNRGASFWIPVLTRRRVRTTQALNFGVNGDTSSQLLARIGAIVASNADIVVVHIGTNDVNGTVSEATFTTYTANMAAIWGALLSAGKVVVAIPPLPRDIATAANREMLWRMIRWVREQQWAGRRNFFVVDPSLPFVDPLSPTGAPKTAYTYDGLHPKAQGAFYFAKPIADLLASLYPASNDNPMVSAADLYSATNKTGNLLINGILNGTAGTLGGAGGGTFTGAIADGFNADVYANGGTLTGLIVTAAKGTAADARPFQQFALSGTYVGGFDTAVSFRQLATNYSSFAPGDIVVGELEYEIDGQAADQNIASIQCNLSLTMGGTAYTVRDGAAGSVADQIAAPAHAGTLRTPPLTVTAQPTLISCGVSVNLRQSGATTLTAQSTFRIKGVSLRKVIA